MIYLFLISNDIQNIFFFFSQVSLKYKLYLLWDFFLVCESKEVENYKALNTIEHIHAVNSEKERIALLDL